MTTAATIETLTAAVETARAASRSSRSRCTCGHCLTCIGE